MNIKVIKKLIPEEICEDGGASVIIVGKETVDLETSIDEAKDVLIVVGDKLLVKGMFVGLFKSMVNGIGRDGNARQLGDFITLYPVPTGEFDLDRGWQPGVNGVRIRARLMNELEIDVSNWEFEDVTPGRQPFTLASVECGELGAVDFVHPVWINGKPLPLTDDIRVDWAVEGTDRRGTVPAGKVTSTASRATIAADALDVLDDPANEGKTVDFTVRGNFSSARIAATLRTSPLLATSPDGLSKVRTLNGKSDLAELAPVPSSGAFELAGVGLSRYVGDAPTLVWGEDEDESVQLSDFTEGSAANSIRSTIGSSEVMLPTGVTTCRLTLGEGETALDLGPVKVERS